MTNHNGLLTSRSSSFCASNLTFDKSSLSSEKQEPAPSDQNHGSKEDGGMLPVIDSNLNEYILLLDHPSISRYYPYFSSLSGC
ncbi:hypothetical protein NPIL_267531 [Nephila pilipes]|uniref:Uncharacterized protein n=1 Tax=Nephila pilipes TaxID=299642 RepID=A0A8X6T3N8_NEPPI|nr:hypothetical protein NPIL_267531 [Nephila pilipes]